MKKNLLMLLLLLNAVFSISARAQDINVSMQPIWGPEGYNYVNYYYIPAIEAYYSVPNQTFTWYDGTRWVTTMDLPPAYANFDLYHAYKVVLNVANPWYRHNYYRGYYYSYRTRYDQPMIRYSHDRRYYEGRREDRFYHGERRAEFEHRGGEVRREEGRRMEEHRGGEIRREEGRRGGEVHRAEERRGGGGEHRGGEVHRGGGGRGEGERKEHH